MIINVNAIDNPNTKIVSNITFKALPAFDIKYQMQAKVFRQEGDLKYEYNPFRNLFSSTDGALQDFRVKNKLGFNLNNPIDLTIQPSYDGSVNVILNDDRNPPRLINSRFTTKEDMTYEVVDRIGNNDTNLYREKDVAQTTRLFKTSENIPYIEYSGLSEGGNAPVGNYVFYLKYCDADGNESDIVAESGVISCHMGKINDPFSAKGGLGDENSNKLIKFAVNNLDTAYDYLNIYFSRVTGDYAKEPITKYYKVRAKKPISNQTSIEIIYTGYVEIDEISIDLLNIQYNVVDKVKTQTQVQNMLFLGNVDKPTIPHSELTDLAVRFYPFINNKENIGKLNHEYQPAFLNRQLDNYEYYNTHNIYRFTGYWDKEIYRVGVVFIMNDDSLSPVFNTRGRADLGKFSNPDGVYSDEISRHYTYKNLYEDGKRVYHEMDDDGFLIESSKKLENGKGVIQLNHKDTLVAENGVYPISIDFHIDDATLDEVRKYAKGFFFVRQKRIPTIFGQGITVGVDPISNTPLILANVLNAKGVMEASYMTEGFKDENNEITNDFSSRLLFSGLATVGGIIAPEILLKSEYYTNLFTGSLYNLSSAITQPTNEYFQQSRTNERHFYIEEYHTNQSLKNINKDVKLTLIEDNKPLRFSGTKRFSTRAGIPEEAWRTSFFNREDKSANSKSLLRGAFTGFVGSEGYHAPTAIVNFHISGYDPANMRDYFLVRANSSDPFHAISDRYDFNLIDKSNKYNSLNQLTSHKRFSLYRGDCFINTVTTRIQRNFQDPEVPISDTIIDSFTWKDNYKGFGLNGALNNADLNKINRNDVNAVQMGHWITYKICSNTNLAFRTEDESVSAEYALTGKSRSFYPLSSMSIKGESKIPESTIINAGYGSTVSQKIFYPSPDVPYDKNIFDTRIMFSEVHITDGFRNGFRIFQGLSYKDITRQFGGIVKLFNIKENLLCVFEQGIGILPINREALIPSGEAGGFFLSGAGVLPEKPEMLSDSVGSYWQDSVTRTDRWVYGVDTIAKKIWRTDGRQVQTISDFRVQKFLNDNILLSESDKKPMIGMKNVKTHYNAYKGDVIFTFYDSTRDDKEHSWSLCYNEITDKWITRYSWIPLQSENVNNVWFSFDRDTGKKLSLPGYTKYSNTEALGITLKGKTETFSKNGVTRIESDAINIVNLNRHTVGNFKMKGYDYYDRHILKYTIEPNVLDNDAFIIQGDKLLWKGVSKFEKYSFELKVKVTMYSNFNGVETEVQSFYDLLGVKVARNYVWANFLEYVLEEYDTEFSTWFWKHGQAGLFDISTPILPTTWYDKTEPFEFEFVVVDTPGTHKIFNNLSIIANNAKPDSFEFTVTKDAYAIGQITTNITSGSSDTLLTTVDSKNVHSYQKAIDIKTAGRMRGNMTYLEDFWKVEIKPHRFTQETRVKESRVRDKYCVVRVRYSGDDLALITALQTFYTVSYA